MPRNQVYGYVDLIKSFGGFPPIISTIDPWGTIDVNVFEVAVVYCACLCQSLQNWPTLARLKALWRNIHESPLLLDNGLVFDIERLKPPFPKSPDPIVHTFGAE